MAEPMNDTISGWFEEHGDFPENLEPDWPTSEDVAPCIDNGGHLSSQRHREDECPQEDGIDPCCYNSYRNFGGGQGEHEWGCPNY